MAKESDTLDAQNAAVLAELVCDPLTTEHVRVQILNKLLENKRNDNFFVTMFNEQLSLGKCPKCEHKNHWLIPEDDLNQMGWVTHEKDKNVKRHTTAKDCPKYQEACSKKKIGF